MICHSNVDRNDILALLGIQWSDDFEPNIYSKTNRRSVWIEILTLISENYTSNDILIVLKSGTYDIIESRFIKECNDLSNGVDNIFYSMRKNTNICVQFEIISSLGDQPERRSMNYLMLVNSKHSFRFRFTVNMRNM